MKYDRRILFGGLVLLSVALPVYYYRLVSQQPAVLARSGQSTEETGFKVAEDHGSASGFASPASAPATRPAHWARPLTVAGVPNLHQVAAGLYRSAQPTAEGMKNLQALGIKTVINLRTFHSDRDEITGTGLTSVSIPMKAWHAETDDAVKFLHIVSDPKNAPVLVHCQHGADRTGTMCAVYRIAVEGWTKEDALQEMTEGGFGFHGIWDNLIQWINALDVKQIKKEAGLQENSKP